MLSFLVLLMAVQTVAGNMLHKDFVMLEELESLEVEEDRETEHLDVPSWTSGRGSKVLVNVDSFGAVGDGVSDDTQVNVLFFFNRKSFHSDIYHKKNIL